METPGQGPHSEGDIPYSRAPGEFDAKLRRDARWFTALCLLGLGFFFALLPTIKALIVYLTARTTLDRALAFDEFEPSAILILGFLSVVFAVPIAPRKSILRLIGIVEFGLLAAAFAIPSVISGLLVLIIGGFLIGICRFLTVPAMMLLFVVCCFMLCISIPLEPSSYIRATVSHIRSGQRTMATALESYYMDHGKYPESTSDPARKALWESREIMPSFARPSFTTSTLAEAGGPEELLLDPIRLISERRTFAYYAPPGGQGWILISPGPDGIFDVTSATLPRLYDPQQRNPSPALVELTWDPTNGTMSRGDVYRFKE